MSSNSLKSGIERIFGGVILSVVIPLIYLALSALFVRHGDGFAGVVRYNNFDYLFLLAFIGCKLLVVFLSKLVSAKSFLLTSHSSGPADAGRLTPALCVSPKWDFRIWRVCAQARIFSFNEACLFIVVVNSTGVFIATCRSRLGALGAPRQLQLQTTGT